MNIAQIVNGLVIGAGYGLVALGWTLLLGAARVVNFAHGQFFMLGGMFSWWLGMKFGLGYLPSLLVAMLGVAAVGLLVQFVTLRLTVAQDGLKMMIVTFGIGYVITGIASKLFGNHQVQLESPFQTEIVDLAGTRVSIQDLLIVAVTILLFALTAFVLKRTRVGGVVRAVAEDPRLAELYGMNSTRVYLGVFAFSGLLAAMAGGLMSTRSPIDTTIGFEQVLYTFVVVILGGVGRVWGNLLAAMGVGLFAAVFGALFSPVYTTAALFSVILILFAFRPKGLMVK